MASFPMPSCASPSDFARERAFTLVELLVVLTVVATLAGLALAAAQGARSLAEHQRARAELAVLAGAIEAYRTQVGEYPQAASAADLYQALTGYRGAGGRELSIRGREFLPPIVSAGTLESGDEATPALLDPWQHPYVYERVVPGGGEASESFLLYSVGPDGERGTHLGGVPDRTDPAVGDNLYAGR